MAITTKIDLMTRDIEIALMGTEQERSKELAAFARESLAEVMEINRKATGRDLDYRKFVDGREGASEETVKPSGTIAYEFDVLNDLFEWIGDMLVKHSPVLTGRYSDSFVFFADGAEVKPGAPVPEADEYVFVNVQPYARRIERGWSPKARDGVVEVVAGMAQARFGNVAQIYFSYRSVQDAAYVSYDSVRAVNGGTIQDRKREQATRQPAIIILR